MSFNPFAGSGGSKIDKSKWYYGVEVGQGENGDSIIEIEDDNTLGNAKVGDFYFNNKTGEVFICTSSKRGDTVWKRLSILGMRPEFMIDEYVMTEYRLMSIQENNTVEESNDNKYEDPKEVKANGINSEPFFPY